MLLFGTWWGIYLGTVWEQEKKTKDPSPRPHPTPQKEKKMHSS
jgi:hypothetical protein